MTVSIDGPQCPRNQSLLISASDDVTQHTHSFELYRSASYQEGWNPPPPESLLRNINAEQGRPPWMQEDVFLTTSSLHRTEDNMPPIGNEGNTPKKVICKILCLDWSRESVQNPCQHVTGLVIDILPHGRHGKLSFEVDFGDDLGVQVVPVEECETWSPPEVSDEEKCMLEMVVAFIRPQPFSIADILKTQSLRYVDVFGAPKGGIHFHRSPVVTTGNDRVVDTECALHMRGRPKEKRPVEDHLRPLGQDVLLKQQTQNNIEVQRAHYRRAMGEELNWKGDTMFSGTCRSSKFSTHAAPSDSDPD